LKVNNVKIHFNDAAICGSVCKSPKEGTVATFGKVDGLFGLTDSDLDRIAVEKAGKLLFVDQYDLPVMTDTIPFAPEWGTKVVNRQGVGNHGFIVLVGKTPRTRALLRQGKTSLLVKEGVPEQVARVAVSMQYGMEVRVAKLAAQLVEVVRKHGPFQGNSHWSFDQWIGDRTIVGLGEDELYELSFPRKSAAAVIAAEVVKQA
jgi:hypothetical protein